ncbi:MAG: hypothetical protein D6736_18650 [Nitrospinota bacterium]|nr:MAG: hypothetical protein D6736_18650 [Nitrospinota bacterium]
MRRGEREPRRPGARRGGRCFFFFLLLLLIGCATYAQQQVKPGLHLAEYQRLAVTFQDKTTEPYGQSRITPDELARFSQITAEKLAALSLFQSVEPAPDTEDLRILCEIEELSTSYRTFRFWVGLGPGKGAITFTTRFIDTRTGTEVARFQRRKKVPDYYRTVEGLVKVMMQAVADEITAFVLQHR